MVKERSKCMVMLKHIMGKLKNLLQLILKFDVVEFVETPRANDKEVVLVMLKHIMGKIKNLLQLILNFDVVEFVETPRANAKKVVPNDVKEGYFAVLSVNAEEEPKRFVVELHWLTNPSFLKLLKQAEDEYGFEQKGVLKVPCRAEELQKILEFKIGVAV